MVLGRKLPVRMRVEFEYEKTEKGLAATSVTTLGMQRSPYTIFGVTAALLWLMLLIESCAWFGLVALLFSSEQVLDWLAPRLARFDRAVGFVLLLMALGLARLALPS